MGRRMLTLILLTPGEPGAVVSKNRVCQAAKEWLHTAFINYHSIFIISIFTRCS